MPPLPPRPRPPSRPWEAAGLDRAKDKSKHLARSHRRHWHKYIVPLVALAVTVIGGAIAIVFGVKAIRRRPAAAAGKGGGGLAGPISPPTVTLDGGNKVTVSVRLA